MESLKDKLAQLKALHEGGLIDEADYRTQKASLLAQFSASGNSFSSGAPIHPGTDDSLVKDGELGPLDRRYRLEALLGAGGMGAVWKAEDLAASARSKEKAWVALKVLPASLCASESAKQLLSEEAERAKQLGHPNIVRVWDWREDAYTRQLFLVMEYLQGQDLDALLAREGQSGLALTRIIELLSPVVDALGYVWDKHQLVHRDIKPANVFVTQAGEVKLLDFGIAARVRATATASGLKIADSKRSPGYAAPETLARVKSTPRLDVYSLGVMIYQLLERELPFEDPRLPHAPVPEKPHALNERQWQVLQKAFAYQAEQRYETARDFLEALKQAMAPNEDELARERDEARWQQTLKADSIEGYRTYIEQNETGAQVEEAKARIAQFEGKRREEAARAVKGQRDKSVRRWRLVASAVGLFVAFIVIRQLYLAADTNSTKSHPVTNPATLPQSVTVRIGSASPLTGPQAHLGIDIRNGVQLAIEDANATGVEIGGKKVKFEMVAENDEANPTKATNVAQKLVDSKVAGVVGHLNSGASIPASRIYADAGIPQISPSSTNPKYTHQGFKTTFRVVTHDDEQGPALGRFAIETLGAKSIAVIDDSTAYGQGLADAFEATVKAGGARIVAREHTTDRDTDFEAILTKIKRRNPDLVMFGGIDPQAGPMMKQMAELGIRSTFMGGDGLQTRNFIKLAGPAAEGVMASMPGLPKEKMPGGGEFLQKYKAKFNQEAELFAPMGYDAVMVFIDSMRRAGSTDPAKFLPEVGKTNYQGVIGPIRFDEKGDLRNGPITIYMVKKGKWQPLALQHAR